MYICASMFWRRTWIFTWTDRRTTGVSTRACPARLGATTASIGPESGGDARASQNGADWARNTTTSSSATIRVCTRTPLCSLNPTPVRLTHGSSGRSRGGGLTRATRTIATV